MTPEALATLHARCFTVPPPFSAAAFREFLGSEHCFLIAADAGFALGRGVVDEAELLTLAVEPEARRRGQGRALLKAFEAEATRRGAARALLEVAADNIAAQALYGAAGYTESGRRRGYYRAPDGTARDAILMAKSLVTA